jgi:hypothetical protein
VDGKKTQICLDLIYIAIIAIDIMENPIEKLNSRWLKDENISSKSRLRGGRKHPWAIADRQGYIKYAYEKEKQK